MGNICKICEKDVFSTHVFTNSTFFSIKALARLQQTEELKLWLCKLPQTGFKLTQAKKLEFNPNLNNGKVNEFSSRENSPAQQSDKATAQVSVDDKTKIAKKRSKLFRS